MSVLSEKLEYACVLIKQKVHQQVLSRFTLHKYKKIENSSLSYILSNPLIYKNTQNCTSVPYKLTYKLEFHIHIHTNKVKCCKCFKNTIYSKAVIKPKLCSTVCK